MAIDSVPQGATATLDTVNGQITCKTPCALQLPRKHPFNVTFEKAGFETATANVIPRQAGAGSAGMAGNLLVGGLIGVAVDASSGAMKDLYPNPLVVTLTEESSFTPTVVKAEIAIAPAEPEKEAPELLTVVPKEEVPLTPAVLTIDDQ
jgi:hypothetical protein